MSVTSQRFTVQIPPSQSTPVKPGNMMGGTWGVESCSFKFFWILKFVSDCHYWTVCIPIAIIELFYYHNRKMAVMLQIRVHQRRSNPIKIVWNFTYVTFWEEGRDFNMILRFSNNIVLNLKKIIQKKTKKIIQLSVYQMKTVCLFNSWKYR